MRNFPMIVCLLLMAYLTNAQSSIGFSFNAITSFSNNNTVRLSDGDIYEYELGLKNQSFTFSAGLIHTNYIGGQFYLQKEMLISKTDRTYDLYDFTDRIPDQVATESHYELQIPVLAGIEYQNINIGVGPMISYKLNSERSEMLEEVFRIEERKINLGFQFQLAYNVTPNLTLSSKLMRSFNAAADGYYYNDAPVKLNSRPTQLSLGINYYL